MKQSISHVYQVKIKKCPSVSLRLFGEELIRVFVADLK
jgi:hypothetical protein